MKSVLVVDANKISILMTVEACKDVIPKAKVQVAYTGEEALELIKCNDFDFIIVDFDLPDCDGVSFIKELKKTHSIPMFLTAFTDSVVIDAIKNELLWYKDASSLIQKPIDFNSLKEIIERFVLGEESTECYFKPNLKANLSRDKSKSPSVVGEVLKMNLEKVEVKYAKGPLFLKNEKLVLRFQEEGATKKTVSDGILLRGTVFLVDAKRKVVELGFSKLSASVQKKLEDILKQAEII